MYQSPLIGQQTGTSIGNYITSVYVWMTAALGGISVVAAYLANNPGLVANIFAYGSLPLFLLLFGITFLFGRMVEKASYGTTIALFIAYIILQGAIISAFLLVFTASSVALTFAITAGMFAIMSLYGYTTKADLTKFGSILLMALIGLILASLVNYIFKSPTAYYVISGLAVIIYTGLIAYDTQKLKELGSYAEEGTEMYKKLVVMGAFTLVLDVIGLFLNLLQLFGQRD